MSVRLSVANYEVMVANAARRSAAGHGEDEVVPRICDLEGHYRPSTAGKVEIETLEEGREEQILDDLVRSAILAVFREEVSPQNLTKVVEAFEGRDPVEIGGYVVGIGLRDARDRPRCALAPPSRSWWGSRRAAGADRVGRRSWCSRAFTCPSD